MSDPVRYSLITVTNGGAVSVSTGYTSLALCEEARSIALTGMTKAENTAANARYAEWREQHAPAPASVTNRGAVFSVSSSSMSPCYDPRAGESVEMVRGSWVKKYSGDVKWAKCVIEP